MDNMNSTNKYLDIEYTYVETELDIHEEIHKAISNIKLLTKTKKDGTD